MSYRPHNKQFSSKWLRPRRYRDREDIRQKEAEGKRAQQVEIFPEKPRKREEYSRQAQREGDRLSGMQRKEG